MLRDITVFKMAHWPEGTTLVLPRGLRHAVLSVSLCASQPVTPAFGFRSPFADEYKALTRMTCLTHTYKETRKHDPSKVQESLKHLA